MSWIPPASAAEILSSTTLPPPPICDTSTWNISDPCFQNIYLLAIPAMLASVLFVARLIWLKRHCREHHLGRTQWIFWPTTMAMLIGSSALIARLFFLEEKLSFPEQIATGSMAFAWILASVLNYHEHNYQIRSSDPILGYYLISIIGTGIYLQSTAATTRWTPSRDQSLPPSSSFLRLGFPSCLEVYFITTCFGGMIEAWPRGRTTVQQRSGASIFEKSNLISRLSFHYIQRVMSQGYRRPLQLEDVTHLMPDRIRSEIAYKTLATTWFQEKAKFEEKAKKESSQEAGLDQKHHPKLETPRGWLLLKVIGKSYGWYGWAPILICRVVATLLVYVQPVLLGYIMDFIESGSSDISNATLSTSPLLQPQPQPVSKGIMLATCMFFTSLFSSIANAQLSQQSAERGMEIRSGLAGLIYRKALRLSPEARQQSTEGELSNHMSVDAEKWATSALNTLPQWVSLPIEVLLALWMLYQQLGWCALVGLVTILVLIPVQNKVATVFDDVKSRKMEAMDNRIRLVSEVFTGIKAVKMYGWEDAFKSKIAKYRQIEMAVLRRFGIVYAGMTLIFSTTMFMSLLSFGIFALVGGPGGTPGEITPHVIFVSLSLFGLLSKPISAMDHILSDTTSVLVATRRIQRFLLAEELQPSSLLLLTELTEEEQEGHLRNSSSNYRRHRQQLLSSHQAQQPAITVRKGEFSWQRQKGKLDRVSNGVDQDETTPLTEQRPLLFNDSPSYSSNNDAIASSNNSKEFGPTLHNIDFTLNHGSLTAVVGRIGQGKSSLISALIGEMYCINDQGSVELDGTVALVTQQAWIMNGTVRDNILFGRVLNQDWYDRVLDVCGLGPDLEMLPAGDMTEIGERGINLSGGQKQRVSLARAAYQDADIYLLDDPLSAVDAHVDQHLWQNLIGPDGLLKDKTRLLVTHAIHHLEQVDQVMVIKDGTVSEMGSFKELVARKQGFYQLQLEFNSKHRRHRRESQTGLDTKNNIESSGEDVGTTAQDHGGQDGADPTTGTITTAVESKDEVEGNLVTAEKMVSGTVDWAMFKSYAKAASYRNIVLVVVFYILVEVAQVGTGFWLQYWSDAVGQATYTLAQFLLVYGGLTLAYMGFNMALFYIANVEAAILAARHMHDTLLNNLLRQPMAFFDTTPVGRIINRFSTDVEAMDEVIIWNIIDVVYCLVAIAGTLVVISVSTPLFLAIVPFLALAYMFIQSYFIQSSQALKRYMSVSKSPLYQHFAETLAGVSTLRAMGATQRFISLHNQRADRAAETALAFGIANRWLKVRIEFLGSLIVLSAALLAVLNRGQLSAGAVGLSLTYAMAITVDIAYLVRSFSELQHQLISVERIEEYASLRQEAPLITGVTLPNKDWPAEGKIVFRDYSTRYREGLGLALKNISFEVKGGEKIGVVGRTGAGKSSLTLALFRMVEAADSYWAKSAAAAAAAAMDRGANDMFVEETRRPLIGLSEGLDQEGGGGSIEVDGVDIATLGLKTLRQHLAIIPQDPMMFSGSVRENLDPLGEATDEELWQALERAHLKQFIGTLEGGLSYAVAQGGENFSAGQQALMCLARAMLRKTKILVMDEATAAVDVETDELIQQTIRREFSDRTILTIAHRIKTVMDSDKILVLEEGRVKEFGEPKELLGMKTRSVFYQLAVQAGEVKR
ncbi:hypothetical protein BG004_006659 [Podila humilis]|nr:hypothetical protein BG004_006659 [Podila humilis]